MKACENIGKLFFTVTKEKTKALPRNNMQRQRYMKRYYY